MSLKSMSGMLRANHGAIGLRSKWRIAFNRKLVIQSGSPFHHEMSRTVCSFNPLAGLNTYSSTSLHPSLYRPRSRSVVAMDQLRCKSVCEVLFSEVLLPECCFPEFLFRGDLPEGISPTQIVT